MTTVIIILALAGALATATFAAGWALCAARIYKRNSTIK